MGDILVVIPEDWTQLDWNYVGAIPGITKDSVEDWISTGSMGILAEVLINNEVVPPGTNIIAAKLINDTYFLIQTA